MFVVSNFFGNEEFTNLIFFWSRERTNAAMQARPTNYAGKSNPHQPTTGLNRLN
jgi:hypothetical protein